MATVAFILLGYLSGSILYARVFTTLLKKENVIENSCDKCPGTANAYKYGGALCGALTLLCDILKGFLPIFLYIICPFGKSSNAVLSGLLLAAPVVGHIFPIFYRFKGGKGIATTFGCLLAIMPLWQPFTALAVFFIFFSLVLRITPHFHRTLIAYIFALLALPFLTKNTAVLIGFVIITAAVVIRLLTSSEEKERLKVRVLWMC